MITIDERLIRLQARAADKQEAIRQAGQLLVDSGYIDAGYIASMLGRGEVANAEDMRSGSGHCDNRLAQATCASQAE